MMMHVRTRVRFTEVTPEPHVTQEEPGEVGATPKVPKSPHTLQPLKDKQTKRLVRISPQNPWYSKLLMAKKGKAVTVETKE